MTGKAYGDNTGYDITTLKYSQTVGINTNNSIIVNEYSGFYEKSENILRINHFDLYRLKNISELKEIGLESYVNDNSVCVIEWPEIADEFLRGNIMKVYLHHGENENERIIEY